MRIRVISGSSPDQLARKKAGHVPVQIHTYTYVSTCSKLAQDCKAVGVVCRRSDVSSSQGLVRLACMHCAHPQRMNGDYVRYSCVLKTKI